MAIFAKQKHNLDVKKIKLKFKKERKFCRTKAYF